MANIIGQNFKGWVNNQIDARQKMYSATLDGNFTPEQLVYFNQKSAFIKVVSCVDVETMPPGISSEDSGLTGNQLAQKYVLHGGTSSQVGGITGLRAGIQGQNENYAYGSTSDRGLQPMPGVTDFSIKSLNRGSIRESTIKIKAWNKSQFEIISALYLRLGFYIFVEWGHSTILSNDGGVSPNPLSLSNWILSPHSPEEILKKIEAYRKSSNGNYDALIGKVKNFSWSIDVSGNYDIDISVISIGDVIESLKINTSYFSFGNGDAGKIKADDSVLASAKEELTNRVRDARREAAASGEPYEGDQEQDDEDIVFTERFNNDISYYLYLLSVGKVLANEVASGALTADTLEELNEGVNFTSEGSQDVVILDSNPDFSGAASTLGIPIGNGGKNFIYIDWEGAESIFGYYIRLGWFLEFIQKYIIYSAVPKGGDKNPYIKIDYDEKSNICYSIKGQISGDPRVCIIGNKQIEVEGEFKQLYPDTAEFYTTDPSEHGKLMNIYISFIYITKTLKSIQDQNTNKESGEVGQVNLYDFLKTMMADVQESIGGINNFDVVYEAETNEIKIIDSARIPKIRDIAKAVYTEEQLGANEPSTFSIFGVNQKRGSFVKDFSFKTEITNQMSSQISIGATASNTGIEKAGGLANLNQGLVNRVVEKIDAPEQQQPATTELTLEEKFASQLDTYNAYLQSQINTDDEGFFSWLGSFIVDDQTEWDTDLFDNVKGILKTVLNYQIEKETQKINNALGGGKSSPTVGFIPLNANFTFDGLSGIKIYERFRIQPGFLPDNYATNVDYLIKGISHKIGSDNRWLTTIETLSVPAEETVALLDIQPPKLYAKTKVKKPASRPNTSSTSNLPANVETYDAGVFGDRVSYPSGISLNSDKKGQTKVIDGKTYTYQDLILQTRRKDEKIKRVFLHYTAGWDSRQGVIDGWKFSRGRANVGAEYVISATNPDRGGTGKSYSTLWEQLYDGTKYFMYTNSTDGREEIGLEISSFGMLKEIGGGKFKDLVAGNIYTMDGGVKAGTEYIKPVTCWKIDDNGQLVELEKYNGYKYYCGLTAEQIQAIEDVMLRIASYPNFEGTYKFGPEEYKRAFQSPTQNQKYANIKNLQGIFCHSATTGKADLFPQKELLQMLMGLEDKRLGITKGTPGSSSNSSSNTNSTEEQNEYARAWDRSWLAMQKLLLLLDKEAGGTTAVLSPTSGNISDDVSDAAERIRAYFNLKSGGKDSKYVTQGASFAKRYDIYEKFKGNTELINSWVKQYNIVQSAILNKTNWTDVPLYYKPDNTVHTSYGYDAKTYKVYEKKGSKIAGLSFVPQSYISLKTDY